MRPIKFRAWNKKNKIMVYDNEDDSADYWDGVEASNIGLLNSILGEMQESFDEHDEQGYELMQFTGKLDKNGVDIYENDIVCGLCIDHPTSPIPAQVSGLVEYLDAYGQFCVRDHTIGYMGFTSSIINIEVIGNKYESIPVARELPTKEGHVLVCKKNSSKIFACYFENGHFKHDNGDPIENVEWWCSFPSVPWQFVGLNKYLRDGGIDIMKIGWSKTRL